MPVSLGVVCLSLACVNQSFTFVFLVFYWTRTFLDESETEVISLACLVSQHAIRHHVKDRNYPHCAGTIRPIVYRLSRKPDGRDENIPPPKNFRYFLFLAKEDPDIDVSPIFYQGNRLVSENVHLYVLVRSNSVSPL
jgi:hypothetical protein